MERLNRELQQEILQRLGGAYPQKVKPEEIGFKGDDRRFIVNAFYLAEHDLIKILASEDFGVGPPPILLVSINARGLDFLQQDGGLGAILNVVTIRFEAETLRRLVAAKVEESSLPPEEKGRIRTALESMGAEGLKALAKGLVEKGLQHAPDALTWVQALVLQTG